MNIKLKSGQSLMGIRVQGIGFAIDLARGESDCFRVVHQALIIICLSAIHTMNWLLKLSMILLLLHWPCIAGVMSVGGKAIEELQVSILRVCVSSLNMSIGRVATLCIIPIGVIGLDVRELAVHSVSAALWRPKESTRCLGTLCLLSLPKRCLRRHVLCQKYRV